MLTSVHHQPAPQAAPGMSSHTARPMTTALTRPLPTRQAATPRLAAMTRRRLSSLITRLDRRVTGARGGAYVHHGRLYTKPPIRR